jgi:hypothetical protein
MGITMLDKGFTQRRKDRKDAKAGQIPGRAFAIFAIFAPLRETFL